MAMLEFWCCRNAFKVHRIERCVGGDQLTDTWNVEGLFERQNSFTTAQNDMINVGSPVAYMFDETWLSEVDFNLAGYYVEYVLRNGKSEFYRVNNFIEGYDFECCDVDHFELELTRVKRPVQCVPAPTEVTP